MPQSGSKKDECFILVKAQPHRSSKYFETVCCAGIGRDGKWRRQYPVPFRILNDGQKFQRWQWISYKYTTSREDRRAESQKVIPESLSLGSIMKPTERTSFVNPLIRESFDDANTRGESLVLLRPNSLELTWIEKSAKTISIERSKHADLANQMSFLDPTARPLEPCPVQFSTRWRDNSGKIRVHECDDWETSTAFMKFERDYGRQNAIQILKQKFEKDYLRSGLVLEFSTHSRRNVTFGTTNQWLLVGLIRLNPDEQTDLFL